MRRRRRSPFSNRRRRNRPDSTTIGILGVATVAALAFVFWPWSDDNHALCPKDDAETQLVVDGNASTITATIARQRFDCAGTVVLVDPEVHDTLSAARFALQNNAIVLAATMDDLASAAPEIDGLAAKTVYWAGDSSDLPEISRILDVDAKIIENDDAANDNAAAAGTQLDAQTLAALTPTPTDLSEPNQVDIRPLFLVTNDDLEFGALISPAVAQSGGRIGVIDFEATSFEPEGQPSSITLVGNPDPTQLWQYEGFLTPREVLGGGTELFPGRRFVASYGSPNAPSLGVLGEAAGPEEALETLQPYVDDYVQDDVAAVPAFEIIVTVATAEPGSDGDYSSELFLDKIRPWVDMAEERGVYVILDLQPGRSDFLRQAKIYEELLARPNVGLALDPEWRLYDDQRHLAQIGTVDGAEVEVVSQWLAGVVRDNDLPQKLFIVHQFKRTMLTNPELISTPPELATVIHIDGQGDRALKLNTYGVLTSVEANQHLWFGWKNFFDEDNPVSTPAQVLELDPVPVVITYQ